jgi:L-threonylcarbamoyladenylate synthase
MAGTNKDKDTGARPNASQVEQAASILRQGGLVVYPTETFYGIAADHTNAPALDRLAQLKGRPAHKPIALILSRTEEVDLLASKVPPMARELMARYWPGPLTLIMQARPGLHSLLVSSDGGVGMRMSPHQTASGLAAALGRAITATSANLSGGPPVLHVSDLADEIVNGVDMVLDGGPCAGGKGSTMVDVRIIPPKILRQGPVSLP